MTRFWGVEESEKKNKPSFFSAFTLAEMMVVMLILSIVLAAMAPVMTTRYKSKPNNASPWLYDNNNRNNIWFGAAPAQHAMIGQNSYGADDTLAKLLITVGDDTTNFLAFKRNNTNIGRLFIGGTNLLLGNLASGTLGDGSVGVGRNLQTGANSTAVGSSANASGENTVAVGSSVTASGASSIAVGQGSNASAENSVAIGNEAKAENYEVDDSNTILSSGAIAIGQSSKAKAARAVAIGNGAKISHVDNSKLSTGAIAIGKTASTVSGEGSIAIGDNVDAKGSIYKDGYASAISIGKNASADGYFSIAIGQEAKAKGYSNKYDESHGYGGVDYNANWGYSSIAIGAGADAVIPEPTSTGYNKSYTTNTIAIGYNAMANAANALAIGMFTRAGTNSIAIGTNATTLMGHSIALGTNSIANGEYSIAIGSDEGGSNSYGKNWTQASGTNSIAIGRKTIVQGNNSIGIGTGACQDVTGANKICIGAGSGPSSDSNWATDNAERVFIGGKSKFNNGAAVLEVHNTEGTTSLGNKPIVPTAAVVVNGNLVVKGSIIAPLTEISSNSIRPKGGTITSLFAQEGGSRKILRNDTTELYQYTSGFPGDFIGAYSDRRLKYVGKENTSGLDKIRQLKVFNYTFKKDTTKTPHVGVMAQDLQKVFPNAVKKGADGFLTIRMEDMFYAVINAIKELDAKYQAQEKRINELEKRIEKLEAKAK